MFAEPHDLHHEFPDLIEKIREMKMGNSRFSKLFDKYDE